MPKLQIGSPADPWKVDTGNGFARAAAAEAAAPSISASKATMESKSSWVAKVATGNALVEAVAAAAAAASEFYRHTIISIIKWNKVLLLVSCGTQE